MIDALSAQSAVDTALLATRAQAPTVKPGPDIEKTAREFEAMFVSEMMTHMFETVEVDPMFGGGHGEQMFRSFMVQEYGKKIAEGPGIGISDRIRSMMIEMQQRQTING